MYIGKSVCMHTCICTLICGHRYEHTYTYLVHTFTLFFKEPKSMRTLEPPSLTQQSQMLGTGTSHLPLDQDLCPITSKHDPSETLGFPRHFSESPANNVFTFLISSSTVSKDFLSILIAVQP